MTKELLFTVTANDCEFQYYRGKGKGGQKKNKTDNCCRCTHPDSGAVATSEEGRSQQHNKVKAFIKMAETSKFVSWHNKKVNEALEPTQETKEEFVKRVNEELKDPRKTKVEVKGEDGKWVEI